ncbi:unnamed protein product [Prorocentrum cordatum]|uniref:Uncharacterized protein n=1 Tax=Prorocentrum cordatum TaxID=2364126 RepID=A0ABN9US04_9DINO|nr:unnamed protein product [Polarella glacialis]
MRKEQAMPRGTAASQRHGYDGAEARGHLYGGGVREGVCPGDVTSTRWDQCVSEFGTVAAGFSAALQDMRARFEPGIISYCAGLSACEKDEQGQRAFALMREM